MGGVCVYGRGAEGRRGELGARVLFQSWLLNNDNVIWGKLLTISCPTFLLKR